jgi:molybdopterin adenylyltransferase
MRIGRVTISDRASAGVYEDRSGPQIEAVLRELLDAEAEFIPALLPDDASLIAVRLRELADVVGCDLIVTTGGTGIQPRDVTPEATRAVLDRELPGFGEAIRICGLDQAPTALLSRATAGTRGRTLIVNLPGKPAAVRQCLQILAPAIREALAHLRGQDPHSTMDQSHTA